MNRLQDMKVWRCQENLIVSPAPHQTPLRRRGVASQNLERFPTVHSPQLKPGWTEPKITQARLCPQACYGNSGSSGSYIGNIYEDLSYLEVPIEGVFLLDWCFQPTLIQPWNSLYSPSEWVFAHQDVLALGLPAPTQICIRAAPSASQEAEIWKGPLRRTTFGTVWKWAHKEVRIIWVTSRLRIPCVPWRRTCHQPAPSTMRITAHLRELPRNTVTCVFIMGTES